jgi:hypothetical protein
MNYGIGRTLLLSDKNTLDAMRARLTADKYSFGNLVEVIVTSPPIDEPGAGLRKNRRWGIQLEF